MSVGPGALVTAVESGNLAEVKRIGNAMSGEGWIVNWMRHANTTKNAAIRNYLTRKAAENKTSAASMKFGGRSKKMGRTRKRRRFATHSCRRTKSRRN